ncbi:hypothetical protein J6590_067732 [Homalodisca vitripennis]|nr:hypothetical protein J6590_067732 [Homalodisca vitripennis]
MRYGVDCSTVKNCEAVPKDEGTRCLPLNPHVWLRLSIQKCIEKALLQALLGSGADGWGNNRGSGWMPANRILLAVDRSHLTSNPFFIAYFLFRYAIFFPVVMRCKANVR